MMILVTGGSGSGKSAFAEDCVVSFGKTDRIYIATMYPFDEESRKRVQRHRKMRQGKGFETVECYTGLDKIRLPENCTVLLECMSNLVANEMFQEEGAHENTVEAVLKGVRHIREQAGNLVIVTNEIFSEAADYQGETELYQEYLGQINQKIAEIADQVVEVVYGMLIQYLCEQGKGPILAVDADANSNLNEVLGVEVETTLGDVREEIAQAEIVKESPIPKGMSKADYAEMRFEDALTEEDDFDLLVMGRTQGKGCYCYVNGLLQAQLAKYQNHYPYIVVDNEAGMEHISRGVLPSMQTAILVSDCSRRGIQAVGRIAKLIDECNMHPETVGLIVNRAPKGELNDGIKEEIEKQGLHLLGVVPQDETVYEYDCEGRPTAALPEDNPVKVALKEIVKKLNL